MSRVWRFGDDVNTDEIIPGRYNVTTDAEELAQHAFFEIRPDFAPSVKEGDIIIGGNNFGCGSSREHAPIALKGTGIRAVIAKSYARIFYRNAINIGLPVYECPNIEFNEGEEVNFDGGTIIGDNTQFDVLPLPGVAAKIVKSGGIVQYLSEHSLEELNDA